MKYTMTVSLKRKITKSEESYNQQTQSSKDSIIPCMPQTYKLLTSHQKL